MKFILLLLLLISTNAFANYPPSSQYDMGAYGIFSTKEAACAAFHNYTVDPSGADCVNPEGYHHNWVFSYVCPNHNLDYNTNTCTGDNPAPPPQDCLPLKHTIDSENGAVDTGADAITSISQLSGCKSGCEVVAVDFRPNAVQNHDYYSAIIKGVTHHYVGGVTTYTGKSCTSGNPPETIKPTDTCGTGEVFIKVAGKSACVVPPSTVKTVAPTISQTPAGTEPKIVQNTTNPADPSELSKTTVTQISHDSEGNVTNVTSTTTNTINNTYGQNPTESNNTDMSGVMSKLDSINNNLKVTGETSSVTKGNYTANNNFYVTKYPNGISDVMNTAKSNLSQSSIGKLTNDLTPNLGDGGSAPMWTWNFNLGQNMNFGSFVLTTDSKLWDILSIIFIISSLFVARGLIFGG